MRRVKPSTVALRARVLSLLLRHKLVTSSMILDVSPPRTRRQSVCHVLRTLRAENRIVQSGHLGREIAYGKA